MKNYIMLIHYHFKTKIDLAIKYSSYEESECHKYQTWKN